MRIQKQDLLFLSIFLVPGLILYAVFFLYPNVGSLLYAFFNWNLSNLGESRFVGFKNFLRLIDDKDLILKVMGNNLYFTFYGTLIGMSTALLISGLVTSDTSKNKILVPITRSVIYFPNLVPPVATAMMWTFIFSPIYGITTPILKALGFNKLAETPLLGDTSTVKPALLAFGLWGSIGFYFVVFLAAMSNVPRHIYEASAIDGAGKIRQFFTITLPLIRGTIKTMLLLTVAGSFSAGFISIQVITGGGPNRASEILSSYMYEQSFARGNFGYGAAIGTVIFILTFVLFFIVDRFFARGDSYEY